MYLLKVLFKFICTLPLLLVLLWLELITIIGGILLFIIGAIIIWPIFCIQNGIKEGTIDFVTPLFGFSILLFGQFIWGLIDWWFEED